MNLKKVDIKNKGMVQDMSISKTSQEFAFENHNIRIITNEDHTSMSITNLQGPKKVTNISLKGVVIGKCILDKYVIIFTHAVPGTVDVYGYGYANYGKNVVYDPTPDRIYRIDLKTEGGKEKITSRLLYQGMLNFDVDFLIDTTYFIENANVMKVYWVDGLNNPRFINIITPGERVIDESKKVFTPYTLSDPQGYVGEKFNFYPTIQGVPTISLKKTIEYTSELPNGMIQYFVSYYNVNGAETLIAGTSAPITVDYAHRGAKADDPQGSCSVIVNISGLDHNFDYVRLYSATRTAENGELIVRIVQDIKIEGNSVEIIDNGIDQETITPAQLFYIGGQVLIAKTISQKDGTLFLGNLTKKNVAIPESVYTALNDRTLAYNAQHWDAYGADKSIFADSNNFIQTPYLHFRQNKVIHTFDDSASVYYPYKRQVFEDSMKYRTFKGGEIYRFGIQFQSEKGEWTEVMWLGDLECKNRPKTHDDGSVDLNNLGMVQGEHEILFNKYVRKELKKAGLVNYRIMMADPVKHNGRKIKAQGVLCPTLFNLRDRYLGKYAHASWIMRPRNNKASFHHLEPLVDYKSEGAELVTKYTDTYPNVTYDKNREERNTYVGITYITSFTNHCVHVKYVEFESDYVSNNTYDFAGKSKMKVIKSMDFSGSNADSVNLSKLLSNANVSEEEKIKITGSGFSDMYNDQLKSFFISFAIGIVVAASAFIGMGIGSLVGMAISEVLCMLGITVIPASIPVIFEVLTPMIVAAAGASIKIPATVNVSPNADDSQLKDLLGDTWDKLPEYSKELLKRGIIQIPVPGNPKTDAIYKIPLAQRITEIFSDTEKIYYPMYADGSTVKSYGFPVTTLPKVFMPDSIDGGDYVFFQVYQKQTTSGFDLNINDDYFVDESVLTLHSPDITEDSILNSDYKCRVVGYVPIDENNYIKAQIEMNPAPYGELGGIDYEFLNKQVNDLYDYTPFYSGNLYRDVAPRSPDLYQSYRCYLFGPGDIVGPTTEELSGDPKSVVQKKQILNHSYSTNTKYFNNKNDELTYDSNVKLFSESPVNLNRPDLFPITLYEGNYENAYIVKDMEHIPATNKTDEMINIGFHSTAHAVLNLNAPKSMSERIPLLPILGGKDNPNRYLSISDNRISSSGVWTHDALGKDRGLIWDSHFSGLSNNFVYIDYSWLYTGDEQHTNQEWLNLIVDKFKKEGKWKLYSVQNKAIGVNYSLTYPTPNSNEFYGVDNWFSGDRFRQHVLHYYDNNRSVNRSIVHYSIMSDTKPTAGTSYNYSFASVLNGGTAAYFVQYLCRHCLSLNDSSGAVFVSGYANAWFLLGLLYLFDTDLHIPTYANDTKVNAYYKIPDCVSDKESFKAHVRTFRENIKKLFLYCEMSLQTDSIADSKSIEENINQVYSKICAALDGLKYLYHVDVNYLAEQWHKKVKDSKKSGVDEEGNYYEAIKKYAFVNFKYPDGRQYRDGYPADGLIILQYSTYYTDDRADDLTSSEEMFENLKTAIKKGYQYFLQQDSFKTTSTGTKVWNTLKWAKIYSFEKDFNGDVSLLNGYDNSKGYLKYQNRFYVYWDGFESGRFVTNDKFEIIEEILGQKITTDILRLDEQSLNITKALDKVLPEMELKEKVSTVVSNSSIKKSPSKSPLGGNSNSSSGIDAFISTTFKQSGLMEVNLQNTDLYYQDCVNVDEPDGKPYLMMAEIYNDIPYKSLYGGHTESAIKKLTWFPVTDPLPIDECVQNAFGDTYYQRYDCLKTYPASEEDINQNVDITSFMVETHINLDDRTDENRGNFNIMSRPTNFNLFNPVYSNLNDIFVYQTRQTDFTTDKYPNQFVWTLSKNYLGQVDNWTNASFLSLNQCKFPITKICNYRDKLISLNTKSIELIDFNAKSFVQSTDGFIELQNNTKVNGTISISDVLGTNNMSIQLTEKGVYFVEDNENNIIRLNYDGSMVRIGLAKMESWMKQHIHVGDYTFNKQDNIHLEYDQINKELHILNDKYCLIYNEMLEEFTSFVDLQDTVFMFPYNGKTWSVGHLNNGGIYEMYGGDFNAGYDFLPIGYSLHYRVNPEIGIDKVFTNVEFTADMEVNDLNSHKSPSVPFDTIRAWTEYQDTGYKPLSFIRNFPSSLKQKFRIWRADIPRDANSQWGRDRIRNPWIHLELVKHIDPHTDDYGAKMELHNMEVQYMA